MNESYEKQPFKLEDTATVLNELLAEGPLWADAKGRRLVNSLEETQPGICFQPPPMVPIADDIRDASDYLARFPSSFGRYLVLLMQAGATSMGLWEEEELVCHKVIKKYVKRGKGKAQTTYLKTRGKSRYGSRLRLQNARMHLNETSEKLHRWWADYGVADKVFYSCPTRLWPELFAATPAPPFERDGQCYKIGMDVRQPGHDELLKVRNFLQWGAVYRRI